MSWNAKPRGGYSVESEEAIENIGEVWELFQARDATPESCAGALGNVQAESGFNPWRWQSDTVNEHAGYGLFQYTPASGYLALPDVTPNMSTTEKTEGATPEDGARQVEVFLNNELGKWVSSAWRSYWDQNTYADLYRRRGAWLRRWGNGNSITLSQFLQCADLEAATFFFLACFEGPAVPSYKLRYENAKVIIELLGYHSFPIWLLMALKNNIDKIIK